ncbi:MAG: NTP transferase domain-containing protein [Sphingomicrobium sp.]
MSGWTALLLAGSRPGRDPFAEAHGTDLKALIPLAGKPLIAYPAAALLGSPEIASVRVLTQRPERLTSALPDDPRLSVETSGATIAATMEAILTDPATRFPLLVTTADHVLLTQAIIADFCAHAAGVDLAIGVVERAALAARLPGTRRTWIGFRAGAYSGANLFAFGSARASSAVTLWRSIEQERKKGWRLLGALGLTGLLGLARLRTLDQTLAAVGRRLGIEIRKVELTDPLAAVDVDTPADLALAKTLLDGRA